MAETMVRCRPTFISLTGEDVLYHLNNVRVDHDLVAPFSRLSLQVALSQAGAVEGGEEEEEDEEERDDGDEEVEEEEHEGVTDDDAVESDIDTTVSYESPFITPKSFFSSSPPRQIYGNTYEHDSPCTRRQGPGEEDDSNCEFFETLDSESSNVERVVEETEEERSSVEPGQTVQCGVGS